VGVTEVGVRAQQIFRRLSRVYTRATCCPTTCCAQHVVCCRQHVATSNIFTATKLLPVSCPSVAGYKGIHVVEIQATCWLSAQHVAPGVNAALRSAHMIWMPVAGLL